MNIDLERLILSSDKQIIILSAGMQRSGSTWLYNAARLLLTNSPLTRDITSYGWIGDLPTIPRKRIMLIKIHAFDDRIMNIDARKIILYSYRDIRDVLASSKRIWNQEPSVDLAAHLINNDLLWRRCADFIMRYESMICDQHAMLKELASFLKINKVETYEIISQIGQLNYDNTGRKNQTYHMENLLHKGHITDGRHGSWKGILDLNLVKQIENKYRDWFIQNNYPLSE
jgi:hypothetical protein